VSIETKGYNQRGRLIQPIAGGETVSRFDGVIPAVGAHHIESQVVQFGILEVQEEFSRPVASIVDFQTEPVGGRGKPVVGSPGGNVPKAFASIEYLGDRSFRRGVFQDLQRAYGDPLRRARFPTASCGTGTDQRENNEKISTILEAMVHDTLTLVGLFIQPGFSLAVVFACRGEWRCSFLELHITFFVLQATSLVLFVP
jgi:hypothetical protein